MSERLPQHNVIVTIIAYDAEKTLRRCFESIPKDWVDAVIIGDDCSRDGTEAVARSLPGAIVLRHARNRQMGGNQKRVYAEALERGADVVVLLHGDDQFDATRIPALLQPIERGEADVVLGSRMQEVGAREGGMPRYKLLGNRLLAALQNAAYGLALSDYATGYKAYTRDALAGVPFERNRDDFVFDEELNTQLVHFGFRLTQVPVPTRYFPEASTVGLRTSIHYGLFTVFTLLRFRLHRAGLWRWSLLEPRPLTERAER